MQLEITHAGVDVNSVCFLRRITSASSKYFTWVLIENTLLEKKHIKHCKVAVYYKLMYLSQSISVKAKKKFTLLACTHVYTLSRVLFSFEATLIK